MKHVFSNRQIPHLWAHSSQSEARNGKGSLFFSGDTIYSYGHHFPIARHVSQGEKMTGARAILFTTKSHSVTTRRHCSDVQRAIPQNVPVFHVPNVEYGDEERYLLENCRDYTERIEDLLAKCARSRDTWHREWRYKALAELLAEYQAYCTFFSFEGHTPFPVIPTLETLTPKFANARTKERETQRELARQLEYARRVRESAEKLEQWRSGELIYATFHGQPTALRISGDEVETSLGARVPIDHALRGLAFVRAVVKSGVEYVRNGHTFHLGHYAIDRIETNGTLHAGCHVIPYAEIERIAPALESFPKEVQS